MVTLLTCVVTTLDWHSELHGSMPRGVLFFLFKWFGTALRCAFFNYWVDTRDTPERRGCFRWDLFWTPNKKNNFSNFVCVSICFVGVSIFAHAYCFGWEISDFRIISWHLILVDADDNLNFIRCLFAFDICSAWFFLFGPCWRFVVKFQF